MGAKGCDEYRWDFRVNQGTTGRKGVCCGTSWGRDTQAVCLDRS